jgi:hypothetical protein
MQGGASMRGSFRIAGGMYRLIDAVSQSLPAEKIHLSAPLKTLNYEGEQIKTTAIH